MIDHASKAENKTDMAEQNDAITVKIPPPTSADDASLVATIADIVNTVYTDAEQDIFLPSYQRTSSAEVAQFFRNGQLAVAYLNSTSEPVGCIFIKLLTPDRGEFGMLALDAQHRGTGLGRQMALFAEDECRRRGCTIMQLELLVPTTFQHAGKERLQAWYLRMGYKVVKLGSFDDDYPQLAKILAGPTVYKIFEKSLV
ncbi:acyl-CoA N-acyltransferase [Ilyonectria robusta]|uniref:acyl-CoA N-acyltransferase n=1 Tax=Ilyonectria robusta TaxID=1079257 RepID=UPI001E8D858F|nr:acyl-CoA N-acyltransferase [Ilyonectria robusta]KAH8672449.1 acyl-CoA N-acyltransferase [Ilyonectria robusta]